MVKNFDKNSEVIFEGKVKFKLGAISSDRDRIIV